MDNLAASYHTWVSGTPGSLLSPARRAFEREFCEPREGCALRRSLSRIGRCSSRNERHGLAAGLLPACRVFGILASGDEIRRWIPLPGSHSNVTERERRCQLGLPLEIMREQSRGASCHECEHALAADGGVRR